MTAIYGKMVLVFEDGTKKEDTSFIADSLTQWYQQAWSLLRSTKMRKPVAKIECVHPVTGEMYR